MQMLDIIHKRQNRIVLTKEEIDFIAKGAADGTIADYQLSAFLMACYFNPLTEKETVNLTKSMASSGKKLNFPTVTVDKHSTGGVGDGISIALAPLVASAGVSVPMMSGRSLGHTGGTLDKLEAIKNFKVRLSPSHIKRQMKAINVCTFGQSSELVPADRKLYALRDVTATVNSLPLIVASILSKKYAEGSKRIVFDVKFGSGSFLNDYKKCKTLAKTLVKTAKKLKLNSAALLTDMNQPLGNAVGLSLEVSQAIKILQGDKAPKDYYTLLIELAAYMILLAGKEKTLSNAKLLMKKNLSNGAALEKMRQIIHLQGGDERILENPNKFLPQAKLVYKFKAHKNGYIKKLEAKIIGKTAVILGAGRFTMEDKIDYGAGIYLEKKVSDFVRKGVVIAKLYSSDTDKLLQGRKKFKTAVEITSKKVKNPILIKEVIK